MSEPDLSLGQREIRFIQRLKEHPELQERFEDLFAVVENADGDSLTADAAAQRVIEELRQMGHAPCSHGLKESRSGLRLLIRNAPLGGGRKKVLRQTRFGRIDHIQHLDYQRALAEGLPIGSGEIESGHRTVIQSRLKISGAWWRVGNAEKMLALRVTRANREWESYWLQQRQAHT